jgi:tripeptidyl-peptidase-1
MALASAVLSLVGAVHVMERAVRRNNFVQLARSRPDVLHELVFAVQQNNPDVIEQELLTRSSPGSRSYQQWMTFNEVGALVSNAESAASVTQWLQNQGIEVTWKSKRHEYIKATAPIAKWEDLLSTTFYEWEDHSKPGHLPRTQRTVHRAMEYSLPGDLTQHLSAVFNTVQTPPVWKPKYHRAETRNNASLRRAGQASSRSHTLSNSVTPSFLNTLYNITSNHGDAKQQQAVFETGGEYFSSADLSTFQHIYGLPQQAVSRDFGKDAADCNGHDCYEGNLDVQYLMAVAQDTQTVYWYQGGNDPFIDWITAVADDPDPPLVNSISWGSTEQVAYPLLCVAA